MDVRYAGSVRQRESYCQRITSDLVESVYGGVDKLLLIHRGDPKIFYFQYFPDSMLQSQETEYEFIK